MMSNKKSIPYDDLPDHVRERAGLTKRRATKFRMDSVRRHAIVVLSSIHELSQSQRERVLRQAIKMNEV